VRCARSYVQSRERTAHAEPKVACGNRADMGEPTTAPWSWVYGDQKSAIVSSAKRLHRVRSDADLVKEPFAYEAQRYSCSALTHPPDVLTLPHQQSRLRCLLIGNRVERKVAIQRYPATERARQACITESMGKTRSFGLNY
jgi:hypothetical protein